MLFATILAIGGCTSPAISTAPPDATPALTAASPTTLPTLQPSPVQTPSATTAPERQVSIEIDGDKRVVELFVPVAAEGELLPLLVLLHANGEGPLAMASESGAGALAAREHVIVALPPARGQFWNAQVCCGDPIVATPDGAYVGGLIQFVGEDLPIDRGRVFVAGFSMGAVLTGQVACLYAASVTAVALDAGAPWSDECNASEPVSVLVMHGTADTTIPIKEGRKVVATWQAIDGCTGDPVATKLSSNASSWQNDECADGTSVQFVQYGAGHRWFTDPDATEVLWQFFEARMKA